jgi:tetratricopeptide (TPR) repeat protein
LSDINSSISTNEIQNLVAGGEFKKALDALDGKDIQVSKRDFYYFKAVCYRYLKDHKNAHLSLNELIKYFPNYARAYQELGYIYSIKNDEKKSFKSFPSCREIK